MLMMVRMRGFIVLVIFAIGMMMTMVIMKTMTMVMMLGFLCRWLSGGRDRVIAAYKQLAHTKPLAMVVMRMRMAVVMIMV